MEQRIYFDEKGELVVITDNGKIVNFDTAKLAKEKGFDWVCRLWYEDFNKNRLFEPISPSNYNNHITFSKVISAPTQSLLQKWLREKHKIFIEIYVQWDNICDFNLLNEDSFAYSFDKPSYEGKGYGSYEKTLEIALQEALKLI